MTNQILQKKGIVFNRENNNKQVFNDIVKGKYTYIFNSLEIALSKQFKKKVLDQTFFTDCLALLAVDEIHLLKEWGNNFRLIYAEIKKVCKKIPCYILLLDILATLTKNVRSEVIKKNGFFPNPHLM